MTLKTNLSQPLNEQELTQLESLLCLYIDAEMTFNLSMLDGFLTAIVSAPGSIMPSEWLPYLLGEDDEPKWESEEEMDTFFNLLFRHMNSIIRNLFDDDNEFSALFAVVAKGDDDSEETISPVSWCFGYNIGMSLWDIDESEIPELLHPCLGAIMLFGSTEGLEILEDAPEEEIESLISDIEPSAVIIHHYFIEQNRKHRTEPYRAEKKIKPNEPCPCGSGKKYKKCCLH